MTNLQKRSATETKGLFPFEELDEKKKKILKASTKKVGLLQRLILCCFGGKKSKWGGFNQSKKRRKKGTVVDILESLFVEYDSLLVDLLWKKKVYEPIGLKKIRDDLSYCMPQLV